jgi:Kef-type K+ transport system membrane component KefB
MSAKGLMEIVVLKIMLEMGIISNTTFGALVVMAVLTTAYVMPAVKLISRHYRQPLESLRTTMVVEKPLEVRAL